MKENYQKNIKKMKTVMNKMKINKMNSATESCMDVQIKYIDYMFKVQKKYVTFNLFPFYVPVIISFNIRYIIMLAI
jgi:hypothetical protein